jgi:polysaccharide export outer membrane protein
VIFRRDENWQLMATHVDMNHLRWGNKPCPAGELWVRDSDVIMVPQRPMENANQIIEHLFTRGLYSVFPLDFSVNFARLSTI